MTMKVVSASEDDLLPPDTVVNAEEEEEAGVLVDHRDIVIQPPQGTKWRLAQTRQK